MITYAGLFLVSFVAATVFPAQSEAFLTALLLKKQHSWWILVMVASAGNILGSVFNWALGKYFAKFRDRKWFPLKPDKFAWCENFYHRYGKWSLLLSWVPFIGDPLTVMAGILKEPLLFFVGIVSVAKVGRYLVLTAIVLQWF